MEVHEIKFYEALLDYFGKREKDVTALDKSAVGLIVGGLIQLLQALQAKKDYRKDKKIDIEKTFNNHKEMEERQFNQFILDYFLIREKGCTVLDKVQVQRIVRGLLQLRQALQAKPLYRQEEMVVLGGLVGSLGFKIESF